jgi:polyhydroxyalkanoic acid synthase PhaR subunit
VSEERKEAGSTSPFDLWQEWYRQTEQFWGKAFEQTSDTSVYAAMMGQTLDAYVSFAKALREQTTRSLEAMNLASREDFARLAAQVVALEEKIDTLEDKLDQLLDRLDGARPPDNSRARSGARPRRAR